MILKNRCEWVEKILEMYWDFECAIHGVQREVPVEAHEKLPLPRGEEPAAKPAAKPAASRKSAKPRSSARVSLSIPVIAYGWTRNQGAFHEEASALLVNDSGGVG